MFINDTLAEQKAEELRQHVIPADWSSRGGDFG
jgi:hypothetical protein